MKITSLHIENFKGLRDVSIPISNFVCLTGHNNAGKSSVLQALLVFLDGKRISNTHYYNAAEDIVISVRFTSITENDLDRIANSEHRERIRSVLHNGTITFVRRLPVEGASRLRWLAAIPSDPRFSEETIDALLKGKRPSGAFAESVATAFPELAGQLNARTTVTEVRRLIDELVNSQPPDTRRWVERDLPTGIEASVRSLFPEPVYIPAVKDLADDIKTKDGTSFGRLLGILLNVLAPQLASASKVFAELNAALNVIRNADGTVTDGRHEAVKLIETTVQAFVRENFPSVSVEITIPPPEIKTILSSARMVVDDGVKGELETKGDGLKRSVTFSILRSYAELKRHPTLGSSQKEGGGFLLLFEEPELYLHPWAQRVLFDALSVIAQSDQVLVSTHSPLFFSPECTGTFVKIEKRSGQSSDDKPFGHALPIDLSRLDHRSKFHIISYETSNTAFFSNKVLLVEGPSDFLVIPHIARTLNPEWCLNRRGFALCRLNGKGSIRVYKEFFQAFDVRVIVFADLDCLLDEFTHFEVSEDCRRARVTLIEALDRELTKLMDLRLSMKGIKEAATSPLKRQQWDNLREIFTRSKTGVVTDEEYREAGERFFDKETMAGRRMILEDRTLTEITTLKEKVLCMLREYDVFLLSRGTLENYYPDGLAGPDKPSRALSFCKAITTREQALALCDRVIVDENGRADYEFDVVFSKIFGASD